jgi:maleylpyruvate isomerase
MNQPDVLPGTATLQRDRRWTADGFAYLTQCLGRIPGTQLAGPSALPGWTRGAVVAHVAFNARALTRLAHWAQTGVPTPMYSGPDARDVEIAEGAHRPPAELRALLATEQRTLDDTLDQLDDDMWRRAIRTGRGRIVPAAAIPWLRAREVWLHATDLLPGGTFDELPRAFLAALVADVLLLRGSRDERVSVETLDTGERWSTPSAPPAPVRGRLPDLAGWLTGRGRGGLFVADGSPVPELGPWI